MVRCLLLPPALCLGLALAVGCGESRKGPAEVPVKGQVTLDGKPMAEGEVTLSVAGLPGRPFPVSNGAFSGTALEGKNRVEVRAFKAGPPLSTDPEKKPTKANYIPDKYNVQSKLEADVTPKGPNDFKFDVTSK
jgi:hypothetical protein